MEKKKPNLFDLAKSLPAPSEDQAFDNALDAVQGYLNAISGDEEKIDEFQNIISTFCWEAKKSK
jgi:hypothetical protein